MSIQQTIFEGNTQDIPQTKDDLKSKTGEIPQQKLDQIIDAAYKKGQEDALKEKSNSKEEEGREEGIKEQAKKTTKDKKSIKDKLENLTVRDDITLFSANTLFPFDTFPDTLHIDTTKVTIILREFFGTERVININIKDILDVTFEKSLFLGNVAITYIPKSEGPGMLQPEVQKIQLLKSNDARKAKSILKGLLLAKREEIDISQLDPHEILTTIERFGKSEIEE